MYSHNHPEIVDIHSVKTGILEYGHVFLHLTGGIRTKIPASLDGVGQTDSRGDSYGRYIQHLFRELDLPPVTLEYTVTNDKDPGRSGQSGYSMRIPLPNRTIDDEIAVIYAYISTYTPLMLTHTGISVVDLYRQLLSLFKVRFTQEVSLISLVSLESESRNIPESESEYKSASESESESVASSSSLINQYIHSCSILFDEISSKQFKLQYKPDHYDMESGLVSGLVSDSYGLLRGEMKIIKKLIKKLKKLQKYTSKSKSKSKSKSNSKRHEL